MENKDRNELNNQKNDYKNINEQELDDVLMQADQLADDTVKNISGNTGGDFLNDDANDSALDSFDEPTHDKAAGSVLNGDIEDDLSMIDFGFLGDDEEDFHYIDDEIDPYYSEMSTSNNSAKNRDCLENNNNRVITDNADTSSSDNKNIPINDMPRDKAAVDDMIYHERPSKDRKRSNIYLKSLACALIVGGVAGGMTFGSMAAGHHFYGGSNEAISVTTTSSSDEEVTPNVSSSKTVADIAKSCTPSVVAITTTSVDETINMFGQSFQTESAGSGVIIGKNSDELLIATNNHVINGSDEITVCLNDSKDAVYEANIKGVDSDNDLAVIAVSLSDIKSDDLKSISIATFASADSTNVGDQVVAIGNALGYGQSVTSGYVSALNKEVTSDGQNTVSLLQTDAAINPGNSGGALFNMNGELVGINSAKYADTTVEGMGFAIPVSSAQPILDKLMNETTKTKLSKNYGALGISGQDIGSQISEMYDIPIGVYVSLVDEGSCAEKSGLQKGDVITKFDGQSISSLSELKNLLQYYEAGSDVELTYARNTGGVYEEKSVTVTLDKYTDHQKNAPAIQNNGEDAPNVAPSPDRDFDDGFEIDNFFDDFFRSFD